MGQVLATMAMPDHNTALDPDPTVTSPIALEQQHVVVFGVAADLAQLPCATDEAHYKEVLNWL